MTTLEFRVCSVTTAAARHLDCMVEPIDQELAIRQAGQRIVECLVREQRFDRFLRLARRAGHTDDDREHDQCDLLTLA